MRVALLTNLPEDFDRPRGGVQSTAVALIRALTHYADIELHVLVVNRQISKDRDRDLDGTRVYYRRSMQLPVLIGTLTDQRRKVSHLLHAIRPDIVHACDTSYFKVRHGSYPELYQIQGAISLDTAFGPRFLRLRSHAWRCLEHRGLRQADAVLVNSPQVAQEIADQRTEAVYVADEPVNPEFFDARRRECRNTILFVGKLTELKNPLALVKAAGLLRDRGVCAETLLVGGEDPDYGAKLRETIGRLRLNRTCKLLGRLSRAQLIAELSSASVLAHPSFREHAPAAICEAMVVGVPVVASGVGGIPSMLQDGETGFLIDPADPTDLAKRLEQLLTDADLRSRMSRRARSIAMERFSGEVAARRMVERYHSILSAWQGQQNGEELRR